MPEETPSSTEPPPPQKTPAGEQAVRAFQVRVFFSTLLVLAGLYILLSAKFSPSTENFASGIIGVIIGYWLR